MRFTEFRQPISEFTKDELRGLLINRIKSEEDYELLDRLYQALEKTNMSDRVSGAFQKDPDLQQESFLNYIVKEFIDMPGNYKDKITFLEEYEKGPNLIDYKKLLIPERVQDFKSMVVSKNPVAHALFQRLIPITPQGIGAGEYALAAFSKNIQFSGRSAELAGDLLIDNVMVEVKTKSKSGGRFVDLRKAKFTSEKVAQALKQVGLDPTNIRAISDKAWVERIRPKIDVTYLPKIANSVVVSYFRHIEGHPDLQKLEQAIIKGNIMDIRKLFASLSFENYKAMSKFQGMLVIDVSRKGGQESIYFEEIDNVLDSLNIAGASLYGPDQEIMPNIGVVRL